MPGPPRPSDFGLCWSCQRPIEPHATIVLAEDEYPIPCCRPCWLEMTVAERLEFGRNYRNSEALAEHFDAADDPPLGLQDFTRPGMN